LRLDLELIVIFFFINGLDLILIFVLEESSKSPPLKISVICFLRRAF
jgi:hypothetical protein